MKKSNYIFTSLVLTFVFFLPIALFSNPDDLNEAISSIAVNVNKSLNPDKSESLIHEEWWCDCDVKPARMFFRRNGTLIFTGMFKHHGPAKWQYLSKKKELKIIFPLNSASKSLEVFFKGSQEGKVNYKYDSQKRELNFIPFDSRTETIEFLGWCFYKEEKE